MANKYTRNTLKITQIYNGFKDQTLVVDRTYQRKTVWGLKDNVRLMETIILNLIIPEIFLWDSETDPNTGKTITHIVDGQQRINAIFEYIAGKYKLQRKYLLNESIREKYGDRSFEDLDDDTKKAIWSYEMSVVNLDKDFSIDEVREMFYRLNLTDYNLNEQEKRNSLNSKFGKVSESLANEEFWDVYKIFSPRDIRRMLDVEYCSSLLILSREGIIDQTKNDRIDQVYREFCEEYDDEAADIEKIHSAMKMINVITRSETSGFVSKKIQMYSLFSVMFDLDSEGVVITTEMAHRYEAFVECYVNFKNEYDLVANDNREKTIIDYLNKYKLASSEGVNKISNRMIRFEVLKKVILGVDSISCEQLDSICRQMKDIESIATEE